MLPIYKGIPDLFEIVIDLVIRGSQRDTQAMVAFQQLSKILKTAFNVLTHYFALTLNEDFLKHNHEEPPYQAWAKVTNENFQNLTQSMKSILPVIQHFVASEILASDSAVSYKNALNWLDKFYQEYECYRVNTEEPLLSISTICYDGWFDVGSKRFTSDLILKAPPVVKKTIISIVDRSVFIDLQKVGVIRVEEMRESLTRFATWLNVNHSKSDVLTVPQAESAFDCWFLNSLGLGYLCKNKKVIPIRKYFA